MGNSNIKKIVITGSSGFVASHFLDYLYENDIDIEVYGLDLGKPNYDINPYKDKINLRFYEIDLMDEERLFDLFEKIKPDYVLHLAAFSSVAYSWKYPEKSFINNCNIFLNVINAIRKMCPDCRVLSVGSSEEYGNVTHDDLPIKENQPLQPLSPYAVARVSQEQLSKVFVDAFGMKIIMTRSFNHIGPRQDDRFVIPSFIKRILDIKRRGASEGVIYTGDLTVIRDFVDVRDVVDAYYKLLINGVPGEIYNICSGKGIVLSNAIDIISNELGVKIKTIVNPELVRPNDNHEIVGSCEKIKKELGWINKIKFIDTIKDMIAYQIEQNEKPINILV